MEIAQAFVGLRVDGKHVKADTAKAIHGADMEGEGKKAGSRFAAGMGAIVGTAAAVGLVKFASGSVEAFKEAEVAQARLSDAFAKFPALADISRSSLDRLNESLAKKTRFDDDALASGQAVLAQFGLTGQQVSQLTPLLADYAAKTGTDIPTAAEQLGKGLLGQGRALKSVGIDFQDAGSVGANFEQIMGGLRTQVGGFAEGEGKTAAGQSEILKNRFGELQEAVGEKLLPALQGLVSALLATVDWMGRNQPIVIALVSAFGALAAVLVATKVALLLSSAATGVSAAATAAHTAATAIATSTLGTWIGVKALELAAWARTLPGIIANTVATVAHTVAMGAARAATLIWTAAQWALNAAFLANPIGAVIAVIALLVAGVIFAYKNFDWFREAVDFAWKVIQASASKAWNDFLKPIFTALVAAVVDTWQKMQELARIVGVVWEAIKALFAEGVRIVVGTFLNLVSTIIQGAADAFGWVPGIGGKLREAAARFEDFKNSVNNSLASVQDQEVSVVARLKKEGIDLTSMLGSTAGRMAFGGPVHGPGTGTSDTAGLFALSNNEHVWTAKEVAAAGGHGAVAAMRKGVLGLARGGPAQLNVRGDTAQAIADASQTAREMAADIDAATAKVLKELFSTGGGGIGGMPGGMGYQWQMATLRSRFPGLQLISGYRPGAITATGNASWHGKGRAVDIPPRMDVFEWIRGMYGKNTLELIFSPAGGRQLYKGQPHVFSGITKAMHYDHVHWAYDQGGWLPPGRSIAQNNTGQPERVLGPHDEIRLHPEDITAIVEGIGGYYVNGRMSTVQRATMSRRG